MVPGSGFLVHILLDRLNLLLGELGAAQLLGQLDKKVFIPEP
jgi:hypothetical protein